MKKVLILCSMVALVMVSSCKKDRLENDNIKIDDANFVNGKIELKAGTVLYQAQKETLKASSEAFISDFKNKQSEITLSRPGACGYMKSAQILWGRTDVVSGDYCSGGIIQIAYQYTVIDWAYNLNYSFKLSMGGFINYNATSSVLTTETPLCEPGNEGGMLNPCNIAKVYNVIFQIPISEYNNFGAARLSVTSVCTRDINNQNTIFSDMSFTPPNSYYLSGGGSRVFVSTGNGSASGRFSYYNQCTATLCFVYNTQCPNSTVFQYRLANTNNVWITAPALYTNIAAPAGYYEYRCIMNYSFGSTGYIPGFFTVY